jgi:hypothetical protein
MVPRDEFFARAFPLRIAASCYVQKRTVSPTVSGRIKVQAQANGLSEVQVMAAGENVLLRLLVL